MAGEEVDNSKCRALVGQKTRFKLVGLAMPVRAVAGRVFPVQPGEYLPKVESLVVCDVATLRRVKPHDEMQVLAGMTRNLTNTQPVSSQCVIFLAKLVATAIVVLLLRIGVLWYI